MITRDYTQCHAVVAYKDNNGKYHDTESECQNANYEIAVLDMCKRIFPDRDLGYDAYNIARRLREHADDIVSTI